MHIFRDPMTLFFTLFLPDLELFMLGYAIDTNVRHVRTVILDQAGTQESRQLLAAVRELRGFHDRRPGLHRRGAEPGDRRRPARVGVKIPQRLLAAAAGRSDGADPDLVDGSESSVAAEAVNVGNAIALRESLERSLGGKAAAGGLPGPGSSSTPTRAPPTSSSRG